MSTTPAERQRLHRARLRAIDTPRSENVPLHAAYAAGRLSVHLIDAQGHALCGVFLIDAVSGTPTRSRLCITCLGHATFRLEMSEQVMALVVDS